MTSPNLEAASKSTRTEAQVRAERERLIGQLHLGDIGEVEFTELALDAGMSIERIGAELATARAQDDDGEPYCPGHEWAYTGTAYGGDDPRYMGEGRCYCVHCGADGDA